MKLEWKVTDLDMGFAVAGTVKNLVLEQMPDLADMFPFKLSHDAKVYKCDSWIAFKAINKDALVIPTVGNFSEEEIKEFATKVLPFAHRSHQELYELLGPSWFSFDVFTYVGPCNGSFACWADTFQHIVDWLNHLVVPKIMQLNQIRVLRAIPPPPQYNFSKISQALWILECDEQGKQGTAFMLEGIGLITCHHVLGRATAAFKADKPNQKFPVTVQKQNAVIDLAIFKTDAQISASLTRGSADHLKQMDHIAVAGFPNYRVGDSGVIIPGLVVGFRMISGIRRILTNAPIVAGNSGGPVLDGVNQVIGIAVTGADRMENAIETENHSIVPIDALNFLS